MASSSSPLFSSPDLVFTSHHRLLPNSPPFLIPAPEASSIRSHHLYVCTSVFKTHKVFASTLASPSPRPSVTWGILPQAPETRHSVLQYLHGIGIDTSELADVELPSSVEVMQERIDFLQKLGLAMDDINNYPLMVTCSIKKNMIPVLDYLEKLGITAKDLPGFLRKYPMVLHSSVVIDLMPVLDYLEGLDIRKKDIPSVLLKFPDVLGFRLEGTMSTSVAYLISIGVHKRSIGRMLTECPEIMGMRVANSIKPKVEFLFSLGMPKDIVARLLEMRPQLLCYGLNDSVRPAVDSLLEAGVEEAAIARMITHYPDILRQRLDQKLSEKTQWLVEQVRVSPSHVPRILEQLPQVLFIKEALAMGRVTYLRNAGLSADDVAEMVTDCPQLLAISIKQALEPSLKFLLQDMKRPIREVVDFPAYFTYNLTERIQPRYKLLAKKGIKCSLEWFLNCSDKKFKERLEADYIDDESPGPVFQMGGPLSLRSDGEEIVNPPKKEEATPFKWQGYADSSKLKFSKLFRGGQNSNDRYDLDSSEEDNKARGWTKLQVREQEGGEEDLEMSQSASEFGESENEYTDEESGEEFTLSFITIRWTSKFS